VLQQQAGGSVSGDGRAAGHSRPPMTSSSYSSPAPQKRLRYDVDQRMSTARKSSRFS